MMFVISGTENLVYELIVRTSLYFCLHPNEMTHVMNHFYNHSPDCSFEDELRWCLAGKTNQVTLYALSRVLRCTLEHWVVYPYDEFGRKKIEYNAFVPPSPQTLDRIEMLEVIGESSSEFCLLIAKKAPAPSPAILEARNKCPRKEEIGDEDGNENEEPFDAIECVTVALEDDDDHE